MSRYQSMLMIPQSLYNLFLSHKDASIREGASTVNIRQLNNLDVHDGGQVTVRNDDNIVGELPTATVGRDFVGASPQQSGSNFMSASGMSPENTVAEGNNGTTSMYRPWLESEGHPPYSDWRNQQKINLAAPRGEVQTVYHHANYPYTHADRGPGLVNRNYFNDILPEEKAVPNLNQVQPTPPPPPPNPPPPPPPSVAPPPHLPPSQHTWMNNPREYEESVNDGALDIPRLDIVTRNAQNNFPLDLDATMGDVAFASLPPPPQQQQLNFQRPPAQQQSTLSLPQPPEMRALFPPAAAHQQRIPTEVAAAFNSGGAGSVWDRPPSFSPMTFPEMTPSANNNNLQLAAPLQQAALASPVHSPMRIDEMSPNANNNNLQLAGHLQQAALAPPVQHPAIAPPVQEQVLPTGHTSYRNTQQRVEVPPTQVLPAISLPVSEEERAALEQMGSPLKNRMQKVIKNARTKNVKTSQDYSKLSRIEELIQRSRNDHDNTNISSPDVVLPSPANEVAGKRKNRKTAAAKNRTMAVVQESPSGSRFEELPSSPMETETASVVQLQYKAPRFMPTRTDEYRSRQLQLPDNSVKIDTRDMLAALGEIPTDELLRIGQAIGGMAQNATNWAMNMDTSVQKAVKYSPTPMKISLGEVDQSRFKNPATRDSKNWSARAPPPVRGVTPLSLTHVTDVDMSSQLPREGKSDIEMKSLLPPSEVTKRKKRDTYVTPLKAVKFTTIPPAISRYAALDSAMPLAVRGANLARSVEKNIKERKKRAKQPAGAVGYNFTADQLVQAPLPTPTSPLAAPLPSPNKNKTTWLALPRKRPLQRSPTVKFSKNKEPPRLRRKEKED